MIKLDKKILEYIEIKKELNEIIKAIERDEIPDKDYWYADEFLYEKGYFSWGTLIFKGNKYTFHYNKEEGIFYDTIALEGEDFND